LGKSEKINKYLTEERETLKKKYNRVLPTNELLYDRWEKAKYLGFGKDSTIYDTSVVFGDVVVGDNVWVGPYTLLDGFYAELKIGNFVSINSGVQIYTHDTTDYYLSGGKAEYKKGSVEIGENSVIGSMSIVTQGVKIGKNSLVWANSLVTKDVPDNTIVSGNPAKIIGKIERTGEGIKKVYFDKMIQEKGEAR